MDTDGPFLWLVKGGPRRGFHDLPRSGMCVSAFVFVQDAERRLLLGKYADDPRWEELTGLDEDRWRTHGKGWTVPASHLKFGEDPRTAGRRIADEVLGLKGIALSEPRVESDHYVPARFPELGMHYDLWFLFDAKLPAGAEVETAATEGSEDQDATPPRRVVKPGWYRELAFHDPRTLVASDYARGHEDVVARWTEQR